MQLQGFGAEMFKVQTVVFLCDVYIVVAKFLVLAMSGVSMIHVHCSLVLEETICYVR